MLLFYSEVHIFLSASSGLLPFCSGAFSSRHKKLRKALNIYVEWSGSSLICLLSVCIGFLYMFFVMVCGDYKVYFVVGYSFYGEFYVFVMC